MNNLWEGIGIALTILALAFFMRSCVAGIEERPLFGKDGAIINAGEVAK